jgi:hypothetical protein
VWLEKKYLNYSHLPIFNDFKREKNRRNNNKTKYICN